VKLCTIFEMTGDEPGRIASVSFVDDDHEYGLTPDGMHLHAEGRVTMMRESGPAPPSFTCPRCGMTSYHPDDVREGFCGNCCAWTGATGR
jgi:hypothetical protein